MCGTSVCVGLPYVWYYGITGHSMNICMLAHDNMDGALHCLHACVCMAYVYVCVLAWCDVHCAYTAAHVCVCDCMYVCVCLMVF